MEELKKIDLLRERMQISYSEGRAALTAAEGDVVKALMLLEAEEGGEERCWENPAHKFWRGLKEVYHKAHQTRIKVKRDGKLLFTIPFTVGVTAALGILAHDELTIAAGLGTGAAMLKGYHVELARGEEEEEFIIIS